MRFSFCHASLVVFPLCVFACSSKFETAEVDGSSASGGVATGGSGSGGDAMGGAASGGAGTGGAGTGGAGGSTIGCADGEREGFVDVDRYSDIASCSGAWDVGGISLAATESLSPTCNRGSGDDSSNLDGTGCTVSDLCEQGWHVCASASDVASHLGETGSCDDAAMSSGLFFATRQGGPGEAMCGEGSNDLFGCGTLGSPADSNCNDLDLVSGDACVALGAPWVCASGIEEGNGVTKTSSAAGGVMCCRD